MILITLDCATETGWTCSEHGRIESGVERFDLRRGESAGMRFRRFNLWLRAAFPNVGPGDLVLYEQAHHRGGDATEVGVGLTTRAMEWATEVGADYKGVHTGTLKRYVAGKGNANKDAMITAVNKHFEAKLGGYGVMTTPSWPVTNDNQADALALVIWHDMGMPERETKRRGRRRASRERG